MTSFLSIWETKLFLLECLAFKIKYIYYLFFTAQLLNSCYCKINAWGKESINNVALENYACPRIVFAACVSSNSQDVITSTRDFKEKACKGSSRTCQRRQGTLENVPFARQMGSLPVKIIRVCIPQEQSGTSSSVLLTLVGTILGKTWP